jgi:hypothetical protein
VFYAVAHAIRYVFFWAVPAAVIIGYGLEEDPAALGYPVTAFITLEIRRDPGQQHPGTETAIPLLDGADCRVQRPDHAEPVTQLADRG